MQSGILLIPQAKSRKTEGKDNTSHLLIRAERPAGLGGFVQHPEVAPPCEHGGTGPRSTEPPSSFAVRRFYAHKSRTPREAPAARRSPPELRPHCPIHPCPAGGARPRGRFPRAAPTRPRRGAWGSGRGAVRDRSEPAAAQESQSGFRFLGKSPGCRLAALPPPLPAPVTPPPPFPAGRWFLQEALEHPPGPLPAFRVRPYRVRAGSPLPPLR